MSTENCHERELVEQAKQGNREAFNTLIQIHWKGILYFLERTWGPIDIPKDSDDLLQETFEQALIKIDMFKEKSSEGPSSFVNWLFGIARNVLRKARRERDREQKHREPLTENEIPCNSKIQGIIERREMEMIRRNCINRMTSPYKEVMELAFNGYIDKEIAELLKREYGTIRKQKQRGTIMLKECVKRRQQCQIKIKKL